MRWIGQITYDEVAYFREDVIIEAGNKLGIGTTSPSYPLHVVTESTSYAAYIKNTDNNGGGLIVAAANGGGGTNTILSLRDKSDNPKVSVIENGNVGIGITAPTQALHLPDSKQIALGTGADLKIQHNGTNSEIGNFTGSLNIYTHTDDGDINFMADDGSGGLATYFFLDGSLGRTVFPDNSRLVFGSSSDFDMRHYPSNGMFMNNMSDDFVISNYADDKDIVFKSDDGSGGVSTYFYLDGSLTETNFQVRTRHVDNAQAWFGNSGDLQIYHDGSNSYIDQTGTGNLYIRNNTDDADIIFQSDDGSGGTTAYLTLDGSTKRVEVDVQMGINAPAAYTASTSADELVVGSGSGTQGMTIYGATGTIYFATDLDEEGAGDNPAGNRHGILQYTPSAFTFKTGGNQPAAVIGHGGSSFTSTLTVGVDDTGHDVKFFGATAGKYLLWDESADALKFTDSTQLILGTGNDLIIQHASSNSYINSFVGDLYIKQQADDKDMIFQCDDGSGGVETYFSLDGSLADGSNNYTKWPDNSIAAFGSAPDLFIYHDGTNSRIRQSTASDLIIENLGDDKDIIFKCDDGSGGLAEYFRLDGGAAIMVVSKEMRFADNVKLKLGNGPDSEFYHDGSNTYITNATGNLYIRNDADDKDISFQCDDGSGGTTPYLTLDGSAGHLTVQKEMNFADSVEATFGASNDLKVYHSGSHSYMIQRGTGNLYIQQTTNDADITFTCDDGSGGNAPYLTLDGGLGRTTVQKNMQFADNAQLWLGDGPDFKMFHDGSNTHLQQIGTGDLYIQQTTDDKDIIFQSDNGSGGLTEYLRIDGGSEEVIFSKPIVTAETQIKVLPHQFMSNEDGGANKSVQFRDDTIIGVRTTADDAELYAFVEIPYRKTATSVTVYGNDTSLVVNVYESDINAGALTDKTPGGGCVVGDVCDITDVAYSATNYLVIKVTTVSYTNDIVYGAVVTIT